MAETKAQKIARLQREIDEAEARAQNQYRTAERKREKLLQIANRPPEPEENRFEVRVKFKNTPVLYSFLIVQTAKGYFTTGTGTNQWFRDWESLLDWLDSTDIESHTGLEVLTGTGEVSYPQREREMYPL